ncbi:MAG: hypothetical protein JSR58_07040 [Verrucomicrobia bacterium]|nr:hypothetical protein [Verrucomicrobiota bacterium]
MFIAILLAAVTAAPMSEEEKQLQKIDSQIEKLTKERNQHALAAEKYQQLGDNWQYETNYIQDAYANWAKADAERRQMMDIQMQIDALQEQKQQILQFHPELGES